MGTKKRSMILNVERLPLSELKMHSRNPRHHPQPGDRAWERLKKSLDYDYFDPIVLNKRNGKLVSGHLRVKIMREMGVTEADTVVVDYDEQTHIARMLAANKLIGEWDEAALEELALELKDADFDLDLTGFELEELEAFGEDGESKEDQTYTSKIVPPVYEPKGPYPPVEDLYDEGKCQELLDEINAADLPEDVAEFLRAAATRHTVFKFRNIAEFYAHASEDVQDLMEKSGLVIIDFNKAIEYGFVKLTKLLGELADKEKANAE